MGMPIPVLDVMTDDLEPWPMPAEQVLSGPPRMASRDLYRAPDDRIWIAVWTCTVGSFWSRYAGDETIYLIAGRARITDQDGRSATYRAGQAILIRAGSRCTWEIEEPVRMLFHYRAADDAGEERS